MEQCTMDCQIVVVPDDQELTALNACVSILEMLCPEDDCVKHRIAEYLVRRFEHYGC